MTTITDTLIRLDPWHGTHAGDGSGKHGTLTTTRDTHMGLARYRRGLGQHDLARHCLEVALSAHYRAMRLSHVSSYRRVGQPWRGLGMQYGTKAAGERL